MRFLKLLSIFAMMLGMAMTVSAQAPAARGGAPGAAGPPRPPFVMTVAGGAPDGGDFPLKNSAAGTMMTPSVSWVNPPPGTVTFLIHLHDMDNARNKTSEDQMHWMVWNIPATETGLPEGVPSGLQLADGASQASATGLGQYRPPGFAGNGPKHHYTLELYALDTKIDVANAGDPFDVRAKVLAAAQGHILAKAIWVGLFKRPPAAQ